VQLNEKHDEDIKQVIDENAPSIEEALKSVALGAGLEAILDGGFVIYDKHRAGIYIPDYTSEDTKDVLKASGKGALVGGLRSAVIYVAVNFTPIPACVASGAFTIAEKSIEIAVESDQVDVPVNKTKEKIILMAADVVLTTVGAQVGTMFLKKNRIVGSIIGTAAAKGILYVATRVYNNFTSED
jgi:hypothetical protein